jgi:hypothetical protein
MYHNFYSSSKTDHHNIFNIIGQECIIYIRF